MFWHPFWIFLAEVLGSATLPTPPFPLGFIAITDHPRVGEVESSGGPQSGTVPVRIPISFHPWPHRVWGVTGSQSGPLSHSFQVASWCSTARNCSSLLHTKQIPREASLDLVNMRPKTEWTPSTWQSSRTPVQLGLRSTIRPCSVSWIPVVYRSVILFWGKNNRLAPERKCNGFNPPPLD
jgi:hypothetical protein